jgi:hypothetical protein
VGFTRSGFGVLGDSYGGRFNRYRALSSGEVHTTYDERRRSSDRVSRVKLKVHVKRPPRRIC